MTDFSARFIDVIFTEVPFFGYRRLPPDETQLRLAAQEFPKQC
jgi:hypothetical protein